MSRFDGVPLDPETRVLYQVETQIGGYVALYQKWFWDGISAESFVFCNEDIEGEDPQALVLAIRAWPGAAPETEMTVKRSDSGFTFVNFNFQTS
jgi:hypothetical protein